MHVLSQVLTFQMGPFALFDPYSPDGTYEVDLSHHDERLLLQCLIQISLEDPPGHTSLQHQTYNGMEFTLPSEWLTEIPHHGVYTCEFVSPEDAAAAAAAADIATGDVASSAARRMIVEEVLGWNTAPFDSAGGVGAAVAGLQSSTFSVEGPSMRPPPSHLEVY